MNALKAIMHKEWQHIFRDRTTLFILLLWPVVMLLFFGYAISFELRGVDILVLNPVSSSQIQQQIDALKGSGFFHVHVRANLPLDPERVFRTRQAKALLIYPTDGSKATIMVDGTDPNTAQLISQYVLQTMTPDTTGGFRFEPHFLYNPDLRSAVFFVPGLSGIIMLLLSALLTSIAIVREREKGSFDGLIISPVRPRDIIVGKVFPYAVLAWLSGILVVGSGVLVFAVPFQGNPLLVAILMALYVLAGTSMGILISSIAKTQQIAMLMTLMITMLPTIMLSGFMFPLESMPLIFQWFSNLVPATHFIRILREILLKGNDLGSLWPQITVLTLITLVLIRVSLYRLKGVIG
jgi:ABC-2 type transport system permease protein